MIRSGELKRLIEQAGITGLTSNPTLFERAIDETHDYDDALRRLDADPHLDAHAVYESLSSKTCERRPMRSGRCTSAQEAPTDTQA